MAVNVDCELCKSCSICIYVCPKHVYEIGEQVNSKGYACAEAVRADQCIRCKLCEMSCPDLALYID